MLGDFMGNKKFLILSVLFLVVGFATISTVLYLNSKVFIAANSEDFDIYFNEAVLNGEDLSDTIISADGKSITFQNNNRLREVGDKTVLAYKVTNNSTQYNARVSVNCVPTNDENITIVNDIISIIQAKTMANGTLTLELIKNVTDFRTFNFTCDLVATAESRDSAASGPIEDTDIDKPALAESTSLTGYMVDEREHVIPKATLVAFSDVPKFVEADETGRLYINGLEIGTHEIYYFEKDIDELRGKTKNEIVNQAVTHTTFTTSTKNEVITFPNGYKIQDFYLTDTPNATYNITFDPAGGSVDYTSKEVTQNGKYGELPNPTKAGCTFVGWFYNNKEVKSDYIVVEASQHTLVARWDGIDYELSFDSQGGSPANSKSVTYMSPYGELPNPTLDGYEFEGWYTSTEYDEQITANDSYLYVGNQTLYAKWKANEYTVTFDTNGGTAVNNIIVTYNSKYGSLPTSVKPGYSLTWCLDSDLTTCIDNDTLVTTTSDHKLFAKWIANKYDLVFNPVGGELDTTGKEVEYNQAYGSLPTPTKTGYEFEGWYTQISDGELVTSDTVMTSTESVTIYAHWNVNTYTVGFDSNGGISVATVFTVTYDSEYGETFPIPEREGYEFDGWFDKANGGNQVTSTSIVSIADDHSLYAHWTIKQYDLILSLGSGVDTIKYKVNDDESYITITENTSIKYDFDTNITYYAEIQNGYYYIDCTLDEPCTGKITTSGLTYNPVATRITASMLSFDDSVANLGCEDVQCALSKIAEKLS